MTINAACIVLILLVCAAPSWADAEICLDCHADPELERDTEYKTGSSVYVQQAIFDSSIHEGLDCLDCHLGASDDHPAQLPPAGCADCHEDAVEAVGPSAHGIALSRGVADAPVCADCHGSHDIRSSADSTSTTHPMNVARTCAACHGDLDFIKRRPVSRASPLKAYENSAHFRALQRGENGATCIDCHGSHDLFRSGDPRSRIHHSTIPATCGRCHGEISKVYGESIHGRAVAFGNTDAPDCVDCHGEHEIRGPEDPASSVYPTHVSKTTCVWCHESERLMRRYNLPAERLSTYRDSYHGLADRRGSTVVANCASCHGIHNIRPSSDSLSTVHPSNLPATCGSCHPGAGENVSLGLIHSGPSIQQTEHPLVIFARRFYLALIAATIVLMAMHNLLDLRKNFRRVHLPHGREYLRFTVNERLQHGVLALSFLVLVYSGFALKFPASWWAAPIAWLGDGDAGRRLIHRLAAVAMLVICIWHLGYFLFRTRGRTQVIAMLPRLKDLKDLAQMIAYYLNRRALPPSFDRFSYVEKLEYWALVWGIVVMSITGFSLWFANQALRFAPKWVMDLATVIHYYEAWLATLAIVVWHFYWVIFNPRVYPLSLVWLTGRMSREEMEHEHPLELRALEDESDPHDPSTL